MAKVSYANMKLKVNTDVKTFDFQGHTIEVLQYLPIRDKYDLVMITLEESDENGIFNDLRKDMYFHLNLVYLYSNLTFTEKQKENEPKIYDTLVSSGFMAQFLEALPQEEYRDLYSYINLIGEDINKKDRSATGVLKTLIEDLPKSAKSAVDIMQGFDPTKYQEVLSFAKSANGDRPIPIQ